MSGGSGSLDWAELPQALRAVRQDPANVVVFLDYDGTLAPIVDEPSAAVPEGRVSAMLEQLGSQVARVLVVSGRPVSFLASALGPPPGVELFGLYGMECIDSAGRVRTEAAAEGWRARVNQACALATQQAPGGVHVEPKGLTFTLHWRADPTKREWVEQFARQLQADSGLHAQHGRMSIELRPPSGNDKGSIVADIGAAYSSACYFGDDLGDLPAFQALDELSRNGVCVAKIAVIDRESPPEVAAAADLTVKGPQGAVRLLEGLLA